MGKPYDFSKNFNIRAGILGIFAAALLSYVLSSGLLIYSLRRAWQIYRGNERGESPLQAVSILFLFAVFSDMVQSFANILSARWAFNGKVTEGSYCNAQAILKQVGNDGVACFTIAIAVLTFLQVMSPNALGRYGAKYFVIGAIASTVLFIFLIITVPATIDHPYYGNTDLWCWILKAGQSTRRLRIASEYAVMWLAVVLSAILYGTIVINWLLDAVDSQLRRDAVKMLWYPITYTVVVAPQSIVRFLQFNNYNPPHGIVILTSVLFTSGGTFNVILWLWTGRRFGFSPQRNTIITTTTTTSEPPVTTPAPTATASPPFLSPNRTGDSFLHPRDNGRAFMNGGAGGNGVFPSEYQHVRHERSISDMDELTPTYVHNSYTYDAYANNGPPPPTTTYH